MEITRPIPFVFSDSTPEKELADLSQASAFLLSDLRQGCFDFAGHPESDPFVLCCHVFGRILDPRAVPRKSLFPLDEMLILAHNVHHW